MGKFALVELILRVIFRILTDSDKDGRPDMFDSDPENPEVQ